MRTRMTSVETRGTVERVHHGLSAGDVSDPGGGDGDTEEADAIRGVCHLLHMHGVREGHVLHQRRIYWRRRQTYRQSLGGEARVSGQ